MRGGDPVSGCKTRKRDKVTGNRAMCSLCSNGDHAATSAARSADRVCPKRDGRPNRSDVVKCAGIFKKDLLLCAYKQQIGRSQGDKVKYFTSYAGDLVVGYTNPTAYALDIAVTITNLVTVKPATFIRVVCALSVDAWSELQFA